MKTNPLTKIRGKGTYIVVSLIFLVSAVSLQVLMWLYWDRALQPRLQKEAASQANVLAHSQAVRLADALIVAQPDHRIGLLRETISEILLFTGPVAKEPLFLGLELEIDYEVITAPPDSLDLAGGINQPPKSFVSEVALYSPLSDELMGIARFQVSDSLFQGLSNDVKNTLFTRSWIGTVLLIIVWGGVMILIRETNRSRQQAEMANRTKTVFLANMSHELRTPLNAIIGFSELMNRDQNFSAKQKENLSIINHSGNYLLDLINDVLELSKIEAGKNALLETSFDFYETLDSVVKMMRLRLEKKNLQLVFDLNDDVPRYIISDERKLRQVLLNLLGNAVKFTDHGGVALRVRQENGKRERPESGEIILQFEVEDTGPGISLEEKGRIFEAFTQAQGGWDKKEGTGLGLSISRQFVEQLGGEIQVSSKAGKGTVFGFTIKAKPGVAAESVSPWPARKMVGLKSKEATPADQQYRILVVDDHKANRSLLQLLLEQTGFLVRTAENGEQAVELDQAWKPHLIWMDIRMPVMDGYEATRLIRKARESESLEQPIIIALTASVFQQDREAVIAAGCDDFVRRPFSESDIWDKMSEHLGVEFVYGNLNDTGDKPESALDEEAIAAGINSLPQDIQVRFAKAAEEADYDVALKLISRIKEKNVPLAEFLSALLDSYHFDKLQKYFER